MVIGSISLILALAIVVALFIFLPVMERSGTDELAADQRVQEHETLLSTLLSERDRLLGLLLELDADNEEGKIPSGEYAPLREKLVHQTADTLRRLDELNLAKDQTARPSLQQAGDDELEELIAARRRELSVSDGEPDRKVVFQPRCSICGGPLLPGDRFCPACGHKVKS